MKITGKTAKSLNKVGLLWLTASLLLLVSCGPSDEAKAVDDMIIAIGEVSIDSEVAILDAETAYNALSVKDKEDVSSYETLLAAKNSYNKLKAADINSELKEVGKKKTITQKEVEELNIKVEELPEEIRDLVDEQLIKKATELRPVEKSAIVAVNSLMTTLKNKSSLHLYEATVKEGIGPNGEDMVMLRFSAANSLGVDIDGSECIDIDTTNWTTPAFSLASFYKYMSGEIADYKVKMTMLYAISEDEEISIDIDRIMKNLEIDL